MKKARDGIAKLAPGTTRITLGLSGGLLAMVAAVAIAMRTAHDASSILLFVLMGGVGLALVALAVSGHLTDRAP